ncbi:MAG: hypothetical protein N2327_06710 [Caldimicrobium sp.]|nr:hypothetical protein [Caldimicrobium sp.]MCX7874103.1 hypothetical protein [Caldimicrobium sp.]MDW8093762.1 hypothetical protein [Caldimicrobium sp.]
MRIKKFRAKNMIEALRKVKEEFGDEAVILDSGKVREENQEFYEVVAAVEEREIEISSNSNSLSHSYALEVGMSNYREILKELQDIKNLLKVLATDKKDVSGYLEVEGVPGDLAQKIYAFNGDLREFLRYSWRSKGVNPLSRVQVFVGEAGVGKTTGLYKIAFWFKYYRKQKVAVIETDNYKVGAKEQAQRLSNLLDIPIYVTDWEELGRHLDVLLERHDFLFIDTPSLGKKFYFQELTEIYNHYPSFRFYWVVRSTDYWDHNLEIWEGLKSLPVEGLILTFIDKYLKGYRLFWLLYEDIPLPVFISRGERIPEDIEKINEDKWLELLTRGVKEVQKI